MLRTWSGRSLASPFRRTNTNACSAGEVECNVRNRKKLRLDFRGVSRRGRVMDDTDELLAQLCTRIGMMMEDASAVAITGAAMGAEKRARAILEVAEAVSRISALSDAAVSLIRAKGDVASAHH